MSPATLIAKWKRLPPVEWGRDSQLANRFLADLTRPDRREWFNACASLAREPW